MLEQGIFVGLTGGLVYILIALGLALVFSIMRILQFAHGEIYMLGAYVVYYVYVSAGVNFFVALLISALTLSVLGIILERVMFRRFRGQLDLALLASIGLTLVFQTFGVIFFTTYTKFLPVPDILTGALVLRGVSLPLVRVAMGGIGLVLVLVLVFVIRTTKVGNAMVAISQDAESAALQGINVNRISSISMGIGCALAAIAGGLMGTILQLSPAMGGFAITKAIAVVILGGLGSIPGVIVGGMILGMVDGVVPLYASPTIASIAGFGIIILILLVRPRGLFGHD
jgi:branched-chain amino acid transport system permease protein